jgi:spermidine synthase
MSTFSLHAFLLVLNAVVLMVVLAGRSRARGGVVDSMPSSFTPGAHVRVVATDSHLLLLSGGAIVGAENLPRGTIPVTTPVFAGMALMQTLAFLLPKPRSCLCLGLGAGTAPHFFHSANITTDVIEADEAVMHMAKSHFLIGTTATSRHADAELRIHAGDAEELRAGASVATLAPLMGQYDFILSDLWGPAGNAWATLSQSYMHHIKTAALRPGGVFALNIVATYAGPYALLAIRVVATVCPCTSHFLVHTAMLAPHGPHFLLRGGAGPRRLPARQGFQRRRATRE